jgi:hypothetical protein
MIRYLSYNEIDKVKWDKCIDQSGLNLIYSYSWFLDIVSPHWDAIVYNDYEAVMAVTWKKKFNFRYICMPYFTQQLGIISKTEITYPIWMAFITMLKQKYLLIQYKLNFSNININNEHIIRNNNYILNLNFNYENLYKNFSESNRKNIRRAERNKLVITDNISFEEFTSFMERELRRKVSIIKSNDYEMLCHLLENIGKHLKIEKYVIREIMTKEILSAAIFIFFKNRIIFYSASSEEGKKLKAMFYLLNEFIKDKSETEYILDFSGSNIPDIAYFFKGFGAINQPYFSIQYEKYPFIFKLMKRIKNFFN